MRIIDKMLCLKCNLTEDEKAAQDLSQYEKVRYWLVGVDLHAAVTFEGDNLITYDTHKTWVLNKPANQTVIYPYGAILYDFEKEDFILTSTYDFDEEAGIFTNDDELEFVLCESSEVEDAAKCVLRYKLPFIGNTNIPVSASDQFYTLAGTLYNNRYIIIKTNGVYFRINISDLPSIPYPGLTIMCMDGFGVEYMARITECLEDSLKLDIGGIQAEIGTSFNYQPINVSTGCFVVTNEAVDTVFYDIEGEPYEKYNILEKTV